MNKKLKISLIVFLALILSGVSIWMYALWKAESFWGYLPLVLYLSGWGIWILIREKSFTKVSGNWRLFGLATLTGVLLALGFPPFPFSPFMFVAFVPLLMVENEITGISKGVNKKEFFKYAYHSLVLWNILTTYWVNNTAFFAGFIAIFLNSFFMTIPFLLFHQTRQVLKRNLAYLALVVYWMSFEFGHMRWEISWTWLTMGNAFAMVPEWVQWYEYTGVFGGTLWILLANVLFFNVIDGLGKAGPLLVNWREKARLSMFIPFGCWVIIPIVISLVRYYTYEEKGRTIEVVAINPNYDPHYEKFKIPAREQLKRFLTLSSELVTDSTDYLLFPETSFGGIFNDRILEDENIKALQRFTDQYPKLKLVTGIGSYQFFPDGKSTSDLPAVRTIVRDRDTFYVEGYNAAIQIESGLDEIPIYFKSKLVPGAEFIPYHQILFFLKPIVDGMGGNMEGYGGQIRRSPFFSNGIGVAPVICYESVYGEYTTGYIRNGAQVIFIVTNDGWWDKTAGYRQHLHFARLRAIETRRSIGRSANIGICALINQKGDLLQTSQYGKPGGVKGKLVLNDQLTFYTRMGDALGRIALFIAILLLLNTFVKNRMGKQKAVK